MLEIIEIKIKSCSINGKTLEAKWPKSAGRLRSCSIKPSNYNN